MVSIQHGNLEPIVVAVFGSDGSLLVGKTDIKLKIRRQSTDEYFDWSDNTFKAGAAVVQLLQVLDEVSGVYSPGEYRLNSVLHVNGFDTSLIANPLDEDVYYVSIVQDGGTDVANLPMYDEIKIATFVVADHTPISL